MTKNPLFAFKKQDKYGNVISFKYFYGNQKPVGIQEFKPIFLRVGYMGNTKLIRCSCNNKYVSENMCSIDLKSHSIIETISLSEIDEYEIFSKKENRRWNNTRHFQFDSLNEQKVLQIDKKLTSEVFDYMEYEDFNLLTFIKDYQSYSFNIYEAINGISSASIFKWFYNKFPNLLINNLPDDVFNLAEILCEIDNAYESLSWKHSLINLFEANLSLASQVIANINYISSGNHHKYFQIFPVYNYGVGYCLPVPLESDIITSAFKSNSKINVPLNNLSMYCYFPYYLWERYILEVIELSGKYNENLPPILTDLNKRIKQFILDKIS